MWPDTWKLIKQSSSSSTTDKWLSTYCQSVTAASTVFLRLVMNADIFEDEDFQFTSKVNCFLSQDDMDSLCKQTSTLAQDNKQSDAKGGTLVDDSTPSRYFQLFFQYRTLLFQLHEKVDELVSLSLTLPLSTRGNNLSSQQISQLMTKLNSQGNSQHEENTRQLYESLQQVYALSHTLFTVLSNLLACPESMQTKSSASEEHQEYISKTFLKSLMNIQQTSPARTFPLLSFADSVLAVQNMCQDLLCLCTAMKTMVFDTRDIDIDTLLQWFLSFSRNQSNVLVRSYLVAVWSFLKPNTKVFLLNSCTSRGNERG